VWRISFEGLGPQEFLSELQATALAMMEDSTAVRESFWRHLVLIGFDIEAVGATFEVSGFTPLVVVTTPLPPSLLDTGGAAGINAASVALPMMGVGLFSMFAMGICVARHRSDKQAEADDAKKDAKKGKQKQACEGIDSDDSEDAVIECLQEQLGEPGRVANDAADATKHGIVGVVQESAYKRHKAATAAAAGTPSKVEGDDDESPDSSGAAVSREVTAVPQIRKPSADDWDDDLDHADILCDPSRIEEVPPKPGSGGAALRSMLTLPGVSSPVDPRHRPGSGGASSGSKAGGSSPGEDGGGAQASYPMVPEMSDSAGQRSLMLPGVAPGSRGQSGGSSGSSSQRRHGWDSGGGVGSLGSPVGSPGHVRGFSASPGEGSSSGKSPTSGRAPGSPPEGVDWALPGAAGAGVENTGSIPYPESSLGPWPSKWARGQGALPPRVKPGAAAWPPRLQEMDDVEAGLSPGAPGLPKLSQLRSIAAEGEDGVPSAPAWARSNGRSPSQDRLRFAIINMSAAANLLAKADGQPHRVSGIGSRKAEIGGSEAETK